MKRLKSQTPAAAEVGHIRLDAIQKHLPALFIKKKEKKKEDLHRDQKHLCPRCEGNTCRQTQIELDKDDKTWGVNTHCAGAEEELLNTPSNLTHTGDNSGDLVTSELNSTFGTQVMKKRDQKKKKKKSFATTKLDICSIKLSKRHGKVKTNKNVTSEGRLGSS